MPHGSGHHHGGGGGFGGGHHHHHHHHYGGGGWGRHRHRHRINGPYYGGGHLYYYRRSRLTWAVVTFVVVLVVVISTTVSVRYTSGNHDSDLQYAPVDTRIIPLNAALCQGLQLDVTTILNYYKASLFLLDTKPSLTRSEQFSISSSPYLGYNDYDYHYFYLYPGSKVTVSACIADGYTNHVTFNFIKGSNKFNDWVDDPYPVMSFEVNAHCSSGHNNSHVYNIQKEDYYYLIFDSNVGATQVNGYMEFYRTLYEVKNSTITDSCSVTGDYAGSSCSLSVPLSGRTALLSIYPVTGTEPDMTLGIDLNTTCAPRIWMYVMIALASLVGFVLLVSVPILICVVIKCHKKKAASPSAAPPSAPAATIHVEAATAETDTTPLFSNPYPTNPNYQEPPPNYDESKFPPPPPAYKP